MKCASVPSAYRNCILLDSVRTAPELLTGAEGPVDHVPVGGPRSLVRTNAPPLPGLTCWNSRILKTVPSTSMWLPFLNWLVLIICGQDSWPTVAKALQQQRSLSGIGFPDRERRRPGPCRAVRAAQARPRRRRCRSMRRIVRENAGCAFLAACGCAAMAWLGLYGFAWNDYETEARPAFDGADRWARARVPAARARPTAAR